MSRPIKCQDIETLWMPYLDGKVGAEERARVEMHLADCSACEEQRAGLVAASEVLGTWEAPDPSPWFDARLRRRIMAEAPVSIWARTWRAASATLFPRFPVSVGALMLLGALLISVDGPNQADQPREMVFNDPQKMEELLHVVEEVDLLSDAEFLGEFQKPAAVRQN